MNRISKESQLSGSSRPERGFVQIAGGVLLSVFLITFVQKYIRYGGAPDFDASRSLLFNLLMVVPFIVMIGAGSALTSFVWKQRPIIRAVVIFVSAAAAVALYVLIIGGLLYVLGLSSTWPASPFVTKYVSGAMYVHVGLYLFVQFAVDWADRTKASRAQEADSPAVVHSSRVGCVAGIELSEIRRIESWDHYVKVRSSEGIKIERSTMKELEAVLPPGFIRIHRSHIVNLAFVERAEQEGRYLILVVEGERVRVSASYRPKVESLVSGS